jgi:hypothetical protein
MHERSQADKLAGGPEPCAALVAPVVAELERLYNRERLQPSPGRALAAACVHALATLQGDDHVATDLAFFLHVAASEDAGPAPRRVGGWAVCTCTWTD